MSLSDYQARSDAGCLSLVGVVLSLAILAGWAYVVIHFVRKYW